MACAVAAGSAPAAEHGHNAADLAACNWATPDSARGIAGFDAATGFASTARGGRQREPLMSTDAEIDGTTPRVPKRFAATVPVHVHVINQGPTVEDGNVPDSQIRAQIDVLNQVAEHQPGARRQARPARGRHRRAEHLHDRGRRLPGLGLLPKDVAGSTGRHYLDGIVIAAGSLPGGSIPRFNLGFTATHETGHWIGLDHPVQNGCSAVGDRIDDTPRERFPTRGCPAGQDSCAEPGVDPIHNDMDYSDDPCYTEFTPQQAGGWRSSGSPIAPPELTFPPRGVPDGAPRGRLAL